MVAAVGICLGKACPERLGASLSGLARIITTIDNLAGVAPPLIARTFFSRFAVVGSAIDSAYRSAAKPRTIRSRIAAAIPAAGLIKTACAASVAVPNLGLIVVLWSRFRANNLPRIAPANSISEATIWTQTILTAINPLPGAMVSKLLGPLGVRLSRRQESGQQYSGQKSQSISMHPRLPQQALAFQFKNWSLRVANGEKAALSDRLPPLR